MICSTCGTEVDEYYRGRQCKACIWIPQKAWRKRNREKENATKRKRYKEDPEKFKNSLKISKSKRRTFYCIHQKLYDRYQTIKLTDVFIRKRIRQSVGPTHTITDQEIDERRQQIIRWRHTRVKVQETDDDPISEGLLEHQESCVSHIDIKLEKEPMGFCLMVKREILADICQNVQVNYLQNCPEDCEHKRKKR